MSAALETARGEGISVVAFGDLFLDDIRRYREEKLAGTGMRPVFPIWGTPTATLAGEMIAGGLRARLTCVDPKQLAPAFVGRATSTRRSSASFRARSIPAASAASFTRSRTQDVRGGRVATNR